MAPDAWSDEQIWDLVAFIRRLPEFKFWHSATRAIAISFACTWFDNLLPEFVESVPPDQRAARFCPAGAGIRRFP